MSFFELSPPQIQATAAVIALLVAAVTITVNRKTQREQTARKAHLDYLNIALNHPKLATPTGMRIVAENGMHFENGADEYFEKYEWFVSYLLSTASYIWESVGARHQLHRLMILQVSYHAAYLKAYETKRPYLKLWFGIHRRELERGIKLADQSQILQEAA